MTADSSSGDKLFLTPGEVADLFRVDPKTVTRWAKAKKIPFITTPGGHKRFRTSVVKKMLQEETKQE
jgi:excisionase family DNA binding protein